MCVLLMCQQPSWCWPTAEGVVDPDNDRLRFFRMVCQWWVLHSNQADAEARAGASAETRKDMLPRIVRQSLMDQSPSVVDLMTMTALEVAVDWRLGTFYKLQGMSSGRGQWMMIHSFLIHRSVADSTCVTRAEQSEDRIPSMSPQECLGRCVHLQLWCLWSFHFKIHYTTVATTTLP